MINVAILGFGVVGSGTAEVLSRCNKRSNHRKEENVQLKYIVDLRDFPDSPYADKFVKDFSIIEKDPDLHIVVETIGGVGAAYDMTKRALQAGKCVVSSNKELVATHGTELLAIAKEKGGNYLFEAAVGGGIPILRPLNTCLMANEVKEIRGILNGTTNYILTRMIEADLSFEIALKEAQEKGYAEQNPTADVEGHDACRKICILGNIAYGTEIDPNKVQTEGISNITLEDVAYAQAAGFMIKLLGRVEQCPDGSLSIFVAPHFVPYTDPLYQISDVFNGISVVGDSLGEAMFYGRGAGDLPTASAVVADVLDLAKDPKTFRHNGWTKGDVTVNNPDHLPSMFYVRVNATVETVSAHPMDKDLLLAPIECDSMPKTESAYLVQFTTKAKLQEQLKGLEVLSILRLLPSSNG